MMPNANIPIIGETKKDEPRYPTINLHFQPQGMMMSMIWENGFSMTQVLSAETMDQIVAQWKEVKKQQASAMDMLQHIQKSKIH